ncbi:MULTISPECIES: flagellar biosynthesis anti-sigma factor FlgM [Chromobacterium]|uniref:Negative regulator of flagellin synthesis n=1 Tax=Chromobacterium aquaticum TaxID=467180 RepID=A0ABV8ZZX4_9NEIS|nr:MULTISPECIES: flagellar biosynthesis anti-sigma factor FlgM [Chromobacterium]KMN38307.1 hypothetical protein VI26_00760 [Chromobacterium sp. LK1]MCD5363738.1 flagellar biosynthesis anti-sigma factor FlgM [Chromobacterium aquaticum]
MQINSTSSQRRELAVGGQGAAVETPTRAPAAAATPAASQDMAPAVAELRALPDIDLKRVEEVRAALARGEVRFDAARLADLVEQYHRSR